MIDMTEHDVAEHVIRQWPHCPCCWCDHRRSLRLRSESSSEVWRADYHAAILRALRLLLVAGVRHDLVAQLRRARPSR
jgi:hypothetical protein